MHKKTIVAAFFICFFGFSYGGEFSLQAGVTVNPAIEDLEVEIEILTEQVYRGEDLLFLVELSKEGSEKITVGLRYEVIKSRGKIEEIVASKTDSMELTDSASKRASIQIPAQTMPGRHELRVSAYYYNQSDMDKDGFIVKRKGNWHWLSLFDGLFSYLTMI